MSSPFRLPDAPPANRPDPGHNDNGTKRDRPPVPHWFAMQLFWFAAACGFGIGVLVTLMVLKIVGVYG